MTDNWKKGIQKNFRKLKKNLAKPETIVDDLFNDGILTEEMKEDIMQFQDEPEKMTDRMLTILLRRGPKALPALHHALLDDDCNAELAGLLQPYVEELQIELKKKEAKDHPSEWPPTEEEHDRMKEDKVTWSDIDIMKSKYNSKDTYPMKHKVRGRVLIINNIIFYGKTKTTNEPLGQRFGSEQDEEEIAELFKQLHFEIVPNRNKTAQEMTQIVEEEKTNPGHSQADCFICVIMSHGCPEGIYGVDGDVVNLKTLCSQFDPKNCPALNEKPKLFFIQACRGKGVEVSGVQESKDKVSGVQVSGDGVSNKTDGDEVDSLGAGVNKMQLDTEPCNNPVITGVPTVHSAADFLTAYATPEGYGAWRHETKGSWFLQAVVWTFKYHAHNCNIVDLLTKVNGIVSTGKAKDGHGNIRVTVSMSENSLRKSFYFFPGMVDDPPVRP